MILFFIKVFWNTTGDVLPKIRNYLTVRQQDVRTVLGDILGQHEETNWTTDLACNCKRHQHIVEVNIRVRTTVASVTVRSKRGNIRGTAIGTSLTNEAVS
jgi:hypothetical protein